MGNRIVPAGLYYFENAVSESLGVRVDHWLHKNQALFVRTASHKHARSVAQFGNPAGHYAYKRAVRQMTTLPMPALMEELRDTSIPATLGIDSTTLDHLIMNQYRSEQGILPHIDSEEYGEEIVCFTFGATRTITLSHPEHASSFSLNVAPRSLYVLTGDARHCFRHSMEPLVSEDGAIATSLTFRRVRCHPRE